MVKLEATADIWLSDASERERNSSSGRAVRFKLKSIQEMAAIRFDPAPIKGRKIISARLFLHTLQADNQLRYIRTSTINQDWEEGNSRRSYGPGDGATYNFTDHDRQKPWAWPGSQFCDVSFSSGHSLSGWAERRIENDGWISVELDPDIATALAVNDTDGIAVMDGGTFNPFNNFISSRKSGRYAPYLLVEFGPEMDIAPQLPVIACGPYPAGAAYETGAIRLRIKNHPSVFCWQVVANGRKVDRWRVPHPGKGEWTEFSIAGFTPLMPVDIQVTAVSRSGQASIAAKGVAKASPALRTDLRLGEINPPSWRGRSINKGKVMRVWALPSLVKLSPLRPETLHPDIGWGTSFREANAVWDGRRVHLFGIRGEYVGFQLCVEALRGELNNIRISPGPMQGPHGALLETTDIELYRNWYAKTSSGIWQPAYAVPVDAGSKFSIPDSQRRIPNQQNQTFSVDVYIPKDAEVGSFRGEIAVSANGHPVRIPIQLEVHAAAMPDDLAFWPEMNAYHIPKNVHDYYRLAHQHRCVANFWAFRPKILWNGGQTRVDWTEYDQIAGPLLSGDAFAQNRRTGHPIECLYLPYKDSWPTPLSKNTYQYDGHWPGKGEGAEHLVAHYLNSPYIGDGLSQEYKAAFIAVQRQFIEHFRNKGWDRTELQCFFGGKKSHRINFGSNTWWTTDEPYHWGDWLALQFFTGLWSGGREQQGASKALWAARADISRPQWQGRVLEGRVDTVYFGGFDDDRTYRRCRNLREQTGIEVRAYGSANAHDRSSTETVALVLNAWLNGADGFQTWWSTGRSGSLDVQEGCPGNALFVDGELFGLPVVADLRVKAFRKGQQLVEYLVLLGAKYGLNRQELKHLVTSAVELKTEARAGHQADDADSTRFGSLKAWQIEGLRGRILEMIEN